MHSQFTIGSVIGDSLRVWFKKLPAFAPLATLCYLPLFAPLFLEMWGVTSPQPSPVFSLLGLLMGPLFVVLTGMVTYGTVQHMRGLSAPLGKTFAVGLQRMLPLIGVSFLMFLAIFAGFLILIVPGIMVFLAFYVAAPVTVVERNGVIGALERSNELTLGHKWSILAIVLVSSLISLAIFMAGAVVVGLLANAVSQVALVLLVALYGAMLTLSCVLPAVTYCRLRQHKEGTSVDELAAVFE